MRHPWYLPCAVAFQRDVKKKKSSQDPIFLSLARLRPVRRRVLGSRHSTAIHASYHGCLRAHKPTSATTHARFRRFFRRSNKDGSGWLNIRIICICIRLKYKYRYPYSYLILIWMSNGCIRIRLRELFSIRFHIRIRRISDHVRIRKEKVTSETILNLFLYLIT